MFFSPEEEEVIEDVEKSVMMNFMRKCSPNILWINRRKKMRRGKLKMYTQFWFEKTSRRDHLGEFGVDMVVKCFGCMVLNGRIILNGELKRI
jgi:hypothetical protein